MPNTFRGGGFIGFVRFFGISGSWPFASLTVDFDALTFQFLWIRRTIEKKNVRRLIEEKLFIFSFLLIEHDQPGCPRVMRFSPFSMTPVRDALRNHGYETVDYRQLPGYSPLRSFFIIVAVVLAAAAFYMGVFLYLQRPG